MKLTSQLETWKIWPISRKLSIIENSITSHLQETFPFWKFIHVPSSSELKSPFPCLNFNGGLFTCGVLFFLDRLAELDDATPLLLGLLSGVMLRARRLYREIIETSWWVAWKTENVTFSTNKELTTTNCGLHHEETCFQVDMSDWHPTETSVDEKIRTAVANFLLKFWMFSPKPFAKNFWFFPIQCIASQHSAILNFFPKCLKIRINFSYHFWPRNNEVPIDLRKNWIL